MAATGLGSERAAQPDASILEAVREALASAPDLGPDVRALTVAFDGAGVLTIEGEVASLAHKRHVLQRAAACHGPVGIVDRVRVRPSVHLEDRDMRRHLVERLSAEPALASLDLWALDDGRPTIVRALGPERRGQIRVAIEDGVVTMDGEVPGLDYKRLAGILSWSTSGVRDVVNGLAVEPPEADDAYQIEDAVKLALELDPAVEAAQIRVGVRHTMVRLTGHVASQRAREAAEADAWSVFGVDQVINELGVGLQPST